MLSEEPASKEVLACVQSHAPHTHTPHSRDEENADAMKLIFLFHSEHNSTVPATDTLSGSTHVRDGRVH